MDKDDEIKNICHQMAYGDDSYSTCERYLILIGRNASKEEVEKMREEFFYDEF